MDNEQKLTIVHNLEQEWAALLAIQRNVELHKDALQRGTGAREVAVALTNLETAILWLEHAITVARGGLA